MSTLFSPLRIRGVEFKNRVGVSPMCQYSSVDGGPADWHFVHYGSRAAGGAGFIIQEATAVSPDGRITPDDAGIWNDAQAEAYKRIVAFVHAFDCRLGVQLAHAGRKASTFAPWRGTGEVPKERGGWQTIAPSAVRFTDGFPDPREMTKDDIARVIEDFALSARRCIHVGYDLIELHMAHGYLVHQFLSPLSNRRTDEYGGSLENRCRLSIEIARAVRRAIPDTVPLFVRVSSTDWADGGWDCDQTVVLASLLKEAGVDLVDASSGGNAAAIGRPMAGSISSCKITDGGATSLRTASYAYIGTLLITALHSHPLKERHNETSVDHCRRPAGCRDME